MAATLEDILTKVTTQESQLTNFNTQLVSVVDTQAKLSKSLEAMPAIYPAGFDPKTMKLSAEPIDKTEADRFFVFKSMGHFMSEVRLSCIGRRPTETLEKGYKLAIEKAIVGANETTGSEGGYLVPPEFSLKIFARVYADSALWGRCDNYTVTGNSMVFPRSSETSRVTGSRWGGVSSYWLPEGGAGTLTKPGFGTLSLKLHKMMTLGGVTDEMIADQSVMPQYMLKAFSDEINFMVSDAIVRGTGAGQPKGILNAESLVTVDKESGQAAATIVPQNIIKMYARGWSGCRSSMVWLYNQDIEPQLFSMFLATGLTGQLVFTPPGGLSASPYATLMGRPMIPIEQASTLGTVGDLLLVDLKQVVTISKGGMNQAQSMHFYFDTDQMAFRTTIRLDGQPWWSSALTPYKGSNTQSWAIALATRS